MHQCAGPGGTVAPGWSVYSFTTQASTVLSNGCAAGGSIGDYVFTNGTPGAVTENGASGSQVGLALNVPASAPDVTIAAIKATAIVSPVTGDDAFLGFASAGQSLPGGAELPYGSAADYTQSEQWTLPIGARDFEMYVNCTTDRSSPTCSFPDSTHVPALSNITLTLTDGKPPTLSGLAGSLATAAGDGATVSGNQTLTFAAADADSGVRSATLTLTPQTAGSPYSSTIDFSARCTYDSWNACPLSEPANTFTVNTSALAQATYAVELTATDAAGNLASDYLGTIATKTVPHVPNGSACASAHILLATGAVRARRVRYGAPVTVTGQLRCGTAPIRGAAVELSGTGVGGLLATDARGDFAYRVPTGPSRTLTFRYFPYSDSSAPAASARLRIGVYPRIFLRITPRHTDNGGTITWRGRIRGGPFPTGGLTLLVQVRIGRRWQTFDQLQTRDGRFTYRYTFLRTSSTTTYTFRIALPPSGAAGYDYLAASSRALRVRVAR